VCATAAASAFEYDRRMARTSKSTARVARRGSRQRGRGALAAPDQRAVLIVEHSQAVAQMVAAHISTRLGRECKVVRTLAQARDALQQRERSEWLAAVVNLELADAADEEIVNLMIAHGLPTVVLTGTVDESKRRRILLHDIVDYCLKGKTGIEALVHVLERLQKNPSMRVLVVDDMAPSRVTQEALLESQRFQVLSAKDPREAMALYIEHSDIVLVLVDLSSHAQALELISALRERASRDELAIVALSAARTSHAAAEHLKAGASDFLAKPFEKEEYFCRVYACIDRVENMRRIRQLAFTDGLTGLANRLAFFTRAPELLSAALREGATPVIALLSIDDVDAINEAHGFAAGDQMLGQVGRSLLSSFGPSALCARFSGQQFCVFLPDLTPTAAGKLFERARAQIEKLSTEHGGETLSVTLSCGVVACTPDDDDAEQGPWASIDTCLNRAASALDEAQAAGGNRVVMRS
jgi:diguanylate cyclase (GGDEF)-like protein